MRRSAWSRMNTTTQASTVALSPFSWISKLRSLNRRRQDVSVNAFSIYVRPHPLSGRERRKGKEFPGIKVQIPLSFSYFLEAYKQKRHRRDWNIAGDEATRRNPRKRWSPKDKNRGAVGRIIGVSLLPPLCGSNKWYWLPGVTPVGFTPGYYPITPTVFFLLQITKW